MTVPGEVRGGNRLVARTDVLGAAILMVLVMVLGSVGVGFAVIRLLGLLGLPVDTDTATILRGVLSR